MPIPILHGTYEPNASAGSTDACSVALGKLVSIVEQYLSAAQAHAEAFDEEDEEEANRKAESVYGGLCDALASARAALATKEEA